MTEQNNWQNAAWGQQSPGGAPVPPAGAPQPQAAQPQPAQAAYQAPPANPYGYAQPQAAYAAPAPAAPASAAPPKRRGWIVGLAAVAAILILGIASIASCTAMFTSSMGAFSYESPSWTGTVYGDTVGIIAIDGTIQYDGTTSVPRA